MAEPKKIITFNEPFVTVTSSLDNSRGSALISAIKKLSPLNNLLMFNSIFLDVAIGMVFIYLLYSLLITALQEIIATWLSLRGKYLYKSICIMLNGADADNALRNKFYAHPLIRKTVFGKFDSLPSYIDAEVFAKVMIDILPDEKTEDGQPLNAMERIKLLPDGDLKKALLAYLSGSAIKLEANLKNWFESSMDRLSGAYKRNAQNRLLIMGILVSIAFNVDSITVFRRLSTDKNARKEVIAQANQYAAANAEFHQVLDSHGITPQLKDSLGRSIDSAYARYQAQKQQIEAFMNDDVRQANNAIGIGWEDFKIEMVKDHGRFSVALIVMKIMGWLVTGLALTLGAPFWFDLLQKFIRIRGAGVKPLTEDEKRSGAKPNT